MSQHHTAKDTPAEHLREEFEHVQNLFSAQPPIIQRYLEQQGGQLANALLDPPTQLRFSLPDRIVLDSASGAQVAPAPVAPKSREQGLGRMLFDPLSKANVRVKLRAALIELEGSVDPAIATSASLIRYATAAHLVHNMLPSGRTVVYRSDDDEIPSIPVSAEGELESAITERTDAIVEDTAGESGRGELQVPFVPAARRFYLPQWVAFDDQGNLLVGSVGEAEAHVGSMQNYLEILHQASSLAPYIIADEEYRRKRYGILGQLVNQGRALAVYKTGTIIETIRHRAAAGTLNRGLSLTLPYFDDQELGMDETHFEVIPAGRIMFVPAFVVRAVHQEEAKVSQDTRYNSSTRRHLLNLFQMLSEAFSPDVAH